jgi:hypothetical protein
MTKFKIGPATFLPLTLLIAAALGVALAPGHAFAQDGKRLDAPAPAPAPPLARPSAQASSAMKDLILRKAEGAYYILQVQGLKSFQCVIQPNWAQIVTDPTQLALVSPVQFTAVIDDQGAATVTPFLPSGAAIDPSLNDLVGGLQQTVEGFFQTWNSMVFSRVFSPGDDDQLVYSSQADGYHFAQKTSDANVDIVMTRDALMTAMKVTTSSSVIAMAPVYIATDNGLLLSSMNSVIDSGKQKVNFQLQYEMVDGFEMPAMAAYQVIFPDQTVSIDMSFSSYKIIRQ